MWLCKGVTFVFLLSFPLSLPFLLNFEMLSMCLLFCFVLFWILCCVVCEKMKIKKIVDNKKKRIWVNFTRNGLRLGSRHQEPPHTDVSRNLATVVVFLLLSHSWTTDNVRGVLLGLRRRRTGLLPSGPKSSFQMRASFVFHLETKVLEFGGRVEKLIAQAAWSPVLSFHSLWWFGVQCHLLVLVHCVFWKPTSLHPFTKKFWSTSW